MSNDIRELARSDVAELLRIASSANEQALQDLLDFVCRQSPALRFASIWKINNCSKTISIFSRSSEDYCPQLGENGENNQEFICSMKCPAVTEIVSQHWEKGLLRYNHSIKQSGLFGDFHKAEVVQKHNLDHFISVPIRVTHQPDEFPRFIGLFYCHSNRYGAEVLNDDLSIVMSCVGNIIYNSFLDKARVTTNQITEYLTKHHSIDSASLLDFLSQECLPSAAAFHLTPGRSHKSTVAIQSGTNNSVKLGLSAATAIWNVMPEKGAKTIAHFEVPELKTHQISSALAFAATDPHDRFRSLFVICNKQSKCPLNVDGKPFFVNDFSFDDRFLMEGIGAHIRAFTETLNEQKRRDDVSKIIAHETKQPMNDITDAIASHRRFPNRQEYSIDATLEIVNNTAELAALLAEMNQDLTDDKIAKLLRRSGPSIRPEDEFKSWRRMLGQFCIDKNFDVKNVDVTIENGCERIQIPKSFLATMFLNMVSNSIKYSDNDYGEGWCSVRMGVARNGHLPYWVDDDELRHKGGAGLVFSIADNGIGVDKAYHKRLFDRDFRYDHNDAVQGLGIGLYQVKKVVDALGGRIEVSSSLRKNGLAPYTSRFMIVLPLKYVSI